MSSLNLLGGGARHTEAFRFFNHLPEIKPWARAGARCPEGVAAIVHEYMGADFPVECIEADIIQALRQVEHLSPREGMETFLEAAGRDVRIMLAAIRRNFKRYPERWAALRS